MPVVEMTTYDAVCDFEGCYECVGEFEIEERVIPTVLEQGWTQVGDKIYCERHPNGEEQKQ